MNKIQSSLCSVPLALVLCLFASASLAEGDNIAAPNFQVENIVDGKPLRLDQLRGKVVYLDFWASWCGPCLKSFPFMEELHRQYKDRGLVVVAVNLDQELADAQKFLQENPVTFFIGQNAQGDIAELYDVAAMPSTYIIDADGVIKVVHRGFKSSDKQTLTALIADLL